MTNSTTYMAILEEGEARGEADGRILGLRHLILRQGRKRFEEPSEEVAAQLEAINSVEELETLADRLVEVESWQDLFA